MKRNLIITLIILVLSGSFAQAYAQNITVSGTVTDSQTGASLKRVDVREKGTSTSTRTDSKGYYSVDTAVGKTLVFSAKGYEDLEIELTVTEELLQSKMDEFKLAFDDPVNADMIRLKSVGALFGNNDPLVVVDGIAGIDLNTIPAKDIISIGVLKDVSVIPIK